MEGRMKKLKITIAVLSSVIFALFSASGWALTTDLDANTIAAADYLKHAQADVTEDNAGNGNPDVDPEDGGWDWRLIAPNFTHTAAASPKNIYGATAMGLYYAYLKTADATYLIAMTDAANKMIVDPGIRSASDIQFLVYFQDLPGVTPYIYESGAKAKFDSRISTYGTATALAQYIRDARAGQGYENGIIPWDIGGWAVAAQLLAQKFPADPYDYAQAADDIAEVIYQDSYMVTPGYFDLTSDKNNGWDPSYGNLDYYWYTLGITGIIDAFVSADVHTDKLADLVTILLDCQYDGGAFSYCYGANTDDQDWQSTAYAVRSLARVDPSTYATNINHACYWLGVEQDASGGWVYSSGNHYPEIGGENTAALCFGANLYSADPTEVWVDDDYDFASSGGHLWGYDAFDNIQDGVDAVAAGGIVNVAAGAYDVAATIVVNKAVTISGPSGGGAIVQGTTAAAPVFEISASNVTIQDLEITHNAMPQYPPPAPLPPYAELTYALIRVPINLGLDGIAITGNTIYVPAQSGAMSTWGGIAICIGSGTTTGTGVSITGNTIYNTRNGVVVQYNNIATISNNIIYDTKGGIMNYTNTQADADNRTISNNSWGTLWAHSQWPDIDGTHNEWDIVWNTAYYVPDYQQSVLALSAANNGAFVLDRRAADATACANLTGNRSHIFIDDDSTVTAPHPAKGNFNEPFATIQLGIDAVVAGGTPYIAGGTYYETDISVTKSLVITGKIGDCPGPAPDAPIVDGGGANANGFDIAPGVDNVTIEGFFIRNFGVSPTDAGQGVGVWAYGTSSDPTTNITVQYNQFDNNIWANVFFYNEGQSIFDAIDINCNVVNMGPWSQDTNVYGIECTNCINSSIADNQVSGGYVGILMTAQAEAGTNVTAGDNSITNNTVSAPEFAGMQIVPFSLGGPAPTLQNVSIIDNQLNGDAWGIATYTYNDGSILQNFTVNGNEITLVNPVADGRSVYAFDVAGTSTFNDNTVVHSGTTPLSFFHGLDLGGAATGNWTVHGNVFDGNNVGPNSVGIRLRGTLPATAALDINCNRLKGWNNGIQSDALTNAGLVTVYDNSIAGNATNGFFDNGSATAINAEDNWWGCTGGPGAGGCNPVAGNVDFNPWATSVPPCVSCSDAADCDDGLACNGEEVCNLEVCQAGVPIDCSHLNDQCNTGICEDPDGNCIADPLPDGTLCDDGDTCSVPDECQSGVCTAGGGGDMDGDDICGVDDNCPDDYNPYQEYSDLDGIGNACDNCPTRPNSSILGSCVRIVSGLTIAAEFQALSPCTSDGDCGYDQLCQMSQSDINANGVGDVCECYSDLDNNTQVNLSDLVILKQDFLRVDCPCAGDINEDGKVNLLDLVVMKLEFFRINCTVIP